MKRADQRTHFTAEAKLRIFRYEDPHYYRVLNHMKWVSRWVKRGGKSVRVKKRLYVWDYYDQYDEPITGSRLTQILARLKNAGAPLSNRTKNVRISPNPRGDVQYFYSDRKGNRQEVRHTDWRHAKHHHKFDHNADFGRVLTSIRMQARADLRKQGLPQDKVMAAMLLLMDETGIRPGNVKSRDKHEHYGMTTLEKSHIPWMGIHEGRPAIQFWFDGKKGVENHELRDIPPELVPVLKRLNDLPGVHFFRYRDEKGALHAVTYDDFKSYVTRLAGNGFTPKNLRTWGATVKAAEFLARLPLPKSEPETKKYWRQAKVYVSKFLVNRPAEAEKSYIDSALREAYFANPMSVITALWPQSGAPRAHERALSDDERYLLRFLETLRPATVD